MNELDFICRKLTIFDDWLGCTIEFSAVKEDRADAVAVDNIESEEKYLMIQRNYPEELYEIDWYIIEDSKDLDAIFSQQDKMLIKIDRNSFEMSWSGELSMIGLDISDKKYEMLIKILRTRFAEKVIFLSVDT